MPANDTVSFSRKKWEEFKSYINKLTSSSDGECGNEYALHRVETLIYELEKEQSNDAKQMP